MQAEMPFYESAEQALTAAVQHLGGAKQVGAALWPDKTPDGARTRLLDCLNPSRSERLDMSEAMFILRKAKEKGFHAPFHWISGSVGYEAPRPLTNSGEEDRLTTVIDNATKTLAAALPMLERMQRARAA
ncbi:hypothetical protein [Brevundimonas sp.]|jgi:hypothetical protein|uniref:hypothetical protein n=1 Tax=Brevundimonas sp. TaxID=1871086 RepID=UPI003783EED2